MTNGGSRTLAEWFRSPGQSSRWVLVVGFLGLIAGIVVKSTPGLTAGILVFVGALAYVVWQRRSPVRTPPQQGRRAVEEDISPISPDPSMKTLVFDDFQATRGKYVVKELDEERNVVPSTKTALPVAMKVRPESIRDMEIPDFFDLDSDAEYDAAEPRSEFHSLLNKVLLVLKDVLFAHTVAYFWANKEKQQMVLESMATDSKNFITGKRFAIDQDLVSRVATSGKPQVLGRVNPSSELDLIKYYESPAGVQSVLAVPIFFMSGTNDITPVAVIVADSKAEDQFGNETLELLGRFTKLVSSLIKSYTDKYDLLLESELLSSIRRMHDRLGSSPTEETLLVSLLDEANRLAAWEFLTVVMYSEDQKGWAIQRTINKGSQPYVGANLLIDLQTSVVAEVIRTNSVKSVDDLSGTPPVRFHPSEPPSPSGSFLCVPLSSFNRCYGAVTLEGRTSGVFRGNEIEIIYRLVQYAAAILEVVYMNDIAREQVPADPLTGALTGKYFQRRVEEEVLRSNDLGSELTLGTIVVDNLLDQTQRYGPEGLDAMLVTMVRILRANLRPYDAIGRLADNRIGVLLVNTPASDAYLWAEKVRKVVTSEVITAGTRTFSVTMSMGLCGLSEGMDTSELTKAANFVLEKAQEHGGNLVRVH